MSKRCLTVDKPRAVNTSRLLCMVTNCPGLGQWLAVFFLVITIHVRDPLMDVNWKCILQFLNNQKVRWYTHSPLAFINSSISLRRSENEGLLVGFSRQHLCIITDKDAAFGIEHNTHGRNGGFSAVFTLAKISRNANVTFYY